MGNNLALGTDIEFSSNSELITPEVRHTLQLLGQNLGHFTRTRPHSNNLPTIRKMPDIRNFLKTDLYKQIKASCGLPPTNKLPYENFSLVRALQRREHGLAAPHSSSFTANQQRSIANLYIPNHKESRLMSLDSKVFICKFTKDGNKLLTACQDGCVRIYDSSKGTYHLMNRINGRDITWSMIDADISPCGQFFAYSTWTNSFMIMPINGNEHDCQWLDLDCDYDRFAIFSLRYSPCGRKIIGGSTRSSIYVADIERQESLDIRTDRYPAYDINAISYVCDKDPNMFVCGYDGGTIRLYDFRCLSRRWSVVKCESTFYGHFDGVTYLDARNDGCYILSNSKDQSIKIWDLRQPSSNRRGRQSLNDMPDWDYRWDSVPYSFYNPKKPLANDSSVMTYRGHRVSKTLLRAKFSPCEQTGQRFIYTGCATGRIIIYDVLTGKIKEAIEGHKNVLRDLDWHPERSEIVSGSWDSHVHLNTFKRSAAHMKTNNSLKRHGSYISGQGAVRRSRRLAARQEKAEMPQNSSVEEPEIERDVEGLNFSSIN